MEEPNCAGSGQGVLVLHSVPSHAHTTLIHALDHSPDLQIEINQYDDGLGDPSHGRDQKRNETH